ncbi:MAG: M81 family metallopeptidase [Paenibacillaceae bacterium]|nr:M81 family metallopeptidase [Paenibacillaceae bacterium]
MKVLLAGIFNESHSFTGGVTGIAGFRIARGDELLAKAGDGSMVDGFLSVAAREGWDVVAGSFYDAGASGTADHAVFELFWEELATLLARAIPDGLDAIFLVLHGAMVTTEHPDPEGELMRRIRATPGAEALPLYAVLDLHGNLSAAMGEHADCLVCYRENPHIDARERAVHTAELLARCLKTGVRPRTYVRQAPILWPPTGTGTADAPMRELEAAARRIEREVPGVLAASVWAGYSFADVPDAGVAFSIVAEGDPAPARAALGELAEQAWSLRQAGLPDEHDLEEVMRRILPVARGPVLLVEPADNIGGGAPGDCTDVLRAMLRHDVQGGAVAIADAAAVAALQAVPIGGTATLSIGGKGSPLDPGPVALEVELVSRSDGRFTLEDRNSHYASAHGVNAEMGPSAVVRHRGVTILLTTLRMPPFDLGQWRSQGVHPEQLAVIGVKAAVAHRRAYDKIAAASYTVKTRGPCASDLMALPFRHIRRPIFPLDALE